MILFFNITILCGCESYNPNSYSVEQHIDRISLRIEKEFCQPNGKFYNANYNEFQVYPLYDQNGEVNYYIAEFGKDFFYIIKVQKQQSIILSLFGVSTSMYVLSNNIVWSKYYVNEYGDYIFLEKDSEGNALQHWESPFLNVEDSINKRCIFKCTESRWLFAVQKDSELVNVVSGKKFVYQSMDNLAQQATIQVYFIPKVYFDL